ncbi:MAG: RNA degradosome polyphosphate kinase [Eubacterium sp.]|nr:RNA degradosome polyphosphate kinase [Eubacterium sp.]
MSDLTPYKKPEYYKNRELSWLQFDTRVLNEARDRSIPLFERLKFLAITSSNLDEFYMVRVASLKDQEKAEYTKPDIAGMTPARQLEAIAKETHKLVERQYSTYNRSILPALDEAGLHLIDSHAELSEEQCAFADRYFDENIYPVLTPMALDQSRPFPLIRNKTLNIGALISKSGKLKKAEFATVQVPSVLPRFIELPATAEGSRALVLLEAVIERNIGKLFQGYQVLCAHTYRIMRNAELGIDEDDASDLLIEIEKSLKKRQWGEVIRLEVDDEIRPELLSVLLKEYAIHDADLFRIQGPLDLTFLMKLYDLKGFEHLKVQSYTPARIPELAGDKNLFKAIRRRDIFLHHPYMSFDPVVEFIRQSAADPDVLAIKQTLYRVSGNSPIIAALESAAMNGKQVTVLVELKARFDEENNIVWARELEKAGCHVIYGLVGLKTHSKITLVVRREKDGIRRYVHLGTGNYNDKTARLYTDCAILTCDARIGEDATAVFNMISGYSEPSHWNSLIVAPFWLRKRFLYLIGREEQNALAGKKARIVAKMNSLCDQEIIAALYAASAAGVKIDLIIRGICCLRTGIPGVSENITVRSIVGNFLEHARIFSFYNNGSEEIYMGSADWMPRNLDRRVEIVFPLYDEHTKQQARHVLAVQLADNAKARVMNSEGQYERIDRRGKVSVNAQDLFCEEAQQAVPASENGQGEGNRTFVPQMKAEE